MQIEVLHLLRPHKVLTLNSSCNISVLLCVSPSVTAADEIVTI